MTHTAARYLLVSLGLSITSAAADDLPLLAPEEVEAEIAELCKSHLCRPAWTLRMTLDSGEVSETELSATPILVPIFVTIYPGETIFVEGEVVDGELRLARAVSSIQNPAITITFKMWQEPGKPDTYLSVMNPFPFAVKYRAGMMLPDGPNILHTSSCPVMAGGKFAFEHWPHAIFQLLLGEFRPLRTGEAHVCE